tara:strand:+ start:3869 stop:4360 length:492 start_codon:yes stop_codon:yes gene_type:complete
MKKILLVLSTLMMALGSPLYAQDGAKEKKKGPVSMTERTIKRYEAVGLTDDQTAKIKELAAATETKLAAAKDKAALTDDQKKAQREAMEAAKTAGKKGKEMKDAVTAAVTLSDDQLAAKKEMKTIMGEFGKSVQGLLTDEQKAKLKESRPAKANPKAKPKATS